MDNEEKEEYPGEFKDNLIRDSHVYDDFLHQDENLDDENDIEEEFSSYLSQEDNDKSLNPNSFFKNTEDSFEDVSDDLIRKEE